MTATLPMTGQRLDAVLLRLLAEGFTDEAIGRRLCMHERTARRYIADYMARVGAATRFQAGVIAARRGDVR